MPNFLKILDEFPMVLIVISSNWKDEISNPDLVTIFGSRYVDRIIGRTDTLINGNRADEISSFVRKYCVNKFIAIDDDCRGVLFDRNCKYLFKTDYYKGLTESKIFELREFMLSRGFYAK
jgi:hypothetical protein